MAIVAGAANVREAVYAAAGLRVTAAINAIRAIGPKKCFQHKIYREAENFPAFAV